jgi:DNA-binding CsgD family transcriptional regulator
VKGRSEERGTVQDFVDAAVSGEGGAMLIVGEPGIGKTTLLGHAQTYADELQLLEARCYPSERDIPGTVLHDLFRDHAHIADELPGSQRSAIRAILALEQPSTDPHVIHAGALNMLIGIAATAPMLVTIEDVHWSDPLSAEVLAFAARRLRHEHIAFLMTARATNALPFQTDGISILALTPLDDVSGRRLIEETTPGLDPDITREVVAAAGGNPLALIELTRSLAKEPQGLGRALPVSHLLERSFGTQLDHLTEEERLAALVIAVGSGLTIGAVRYALDLLDIGASVEDSLIESGLVEHDRDAIGFRHPVIRTVVRGRADPGTVRKVHHALGTALDERGARDEATWHLALGTMTSNQAIAARLEDLAARTTNTETSAAAKAYVEAARLSDNRADEERRLLSAAEAWLRSGKRDAVERLLTRIGAAIQDPNLLARLRAARGRIAAALGDPALAGMELSTASGLAEDPEIAALTAVEASEQWILARDLDAAEESARRAVDLPIAHLPHLQILVGLRFADVLAWRGDPSATGRWLAAASVPQGSPEVLEDPMTTFYVAEALMSAGETRRARTMCLRAIDSARAQGMVGALPYMLDYFAQILLILGRLAEAETVASESLGLAIDLGQLMYQAESYGTLALISCFRDDKGSFEVNVEGAARTNALLGYSYGTTARGLMAMSSGLHEEAVRLFAEVATISLERGAGDAMYFLPRLPNLIEACFLAGDGDRANELLADFSEQAERSGRPLARALAERCKGILAPDDGMEDHFQRALGWHEKHDPNPIENGRTELWFGRRLRRAKRKSDARVHLRAALSLLEPCGAALLSSQAMAELAASGETARPREPSTMVRLTPQERQVAALAGDALSTKEVAERLFLSPKTIESHLSSIYRKLQIRSRAELVRLVSEGGDLGP